MADFDVAVVGFGPVGAIAACLFGQAGLRTLVIDGAQAIYDKPRAVALDHEIARVLQGIGLADALAGCTEPFTDSVFFGADGRVIKRMTMLPKPHPQGWTPSMVFLQPDLEAAIRARSLSFPSVTVQLGETLTGLQQNEDAVMLDTAGENGPKTRSARFVVACDGASSFTRKQMQMPLDDLGFDEPWLVVDVRANASGLAKLPKTSVQFCEPSRPTSFILCTGNHRRWEIRLNENENPREMEKPAKVWQLLERWITPEDAMLWRAASYRFHALVATQWRQGRVFIAGDAAHQQPPFLGQGLCQGVRDIANLGWKLIRHIRGEAGEALLESYGAERSGHVRKLTGIIKGIGALIGEHDPVRARARDDRLITEAGGHVSPVPRQELMPALDTGFLSSVSHPARGTLFPQPWIRVDGCRRRLDDLVQMGTAPGFRLVTHRAIDADIRSAIAGMAGNYIRIVETGALDASKDAFIEDESVVRDWFARHKADYALVRPDHYVFGVVSGAKDALALIAEAAGQLK